MTAEERPLLSGALPALEKFVAEWERMQEKYPLLAEGLEAGLTKVTEYYNKGFEDHPAYAVAMGLLFSRSSKSMLTSSSCVVLNPTEKMRWMERNWSAEAVQDVKNAVLAEV